MKKIVKIAWISAVALVVLTLGGVAWLGWQGDSTEIEKVANTFKAPSGWRQTENVVLPPRNFCLTAECPSVKRSWILDQEMDTKSEFLSVFRQSELIVEPSNDCFEELFDGNRSPYCSGVANRSEYVFSISYSDTPSYEPTLTIIVTRK